MLCIRTVERSAPSLFLWCVALVFLVMGPVWAGETIRVKLEASVFAALRNGRVLYLDCRVPKKTPAAEFLDRFLAKPYAASNSKNRESVALDFADLNPDTQRTALLSLFSKDYVDDDGWWHTVIYANDQGQEVLWNLCEWLTGKGTNYLAVMEDERNRIQSPALRQGQQILIPARFLRGALKKPTPDRAPKKATLPDLKPQNEEPPEDLDAYANELKYGSDKSGAYAEYSLKKGEALFSSVVIRFTDYRDFEGVQAACEVILRRSGIKDPREIKAGQKIRIPQEMLSDRFRPKGSEQRDDFERTLVEAKRMRQEKVRTKDLEGVVVVIDPGHGGRDYGGANEDASLYEDEINYDVACRAKKILESTTRAKVYMTVEDKSQGFEPSNDRKFVHDKDEELLTTPHYESTDAKISLALRWYLANSIYRKEIAAGRDPRKMVFTSFHTDALFHTSSRGAMIYIPGAKLRREHETPPGAVYDKFKEAREKRTAESTEAERRRDEALSRVFADDLMEALGKAKIRRHVEGDWIRSQIRQDGGKVYVPSVLRNCLIPTKVLIEMANITNPTDSARVADPVWRQAFAEAYVKALKAHFD